MICLLQLKHLQSVLKKHDAEVLSLEEDKVRMKKVGSFYVFIHQLLIKMSDRFWYHLTQVALERFHKAAVVVYRVHKH